MTTPEQLVGRLEALIHAIEVAGTKHADVAKFVEPFIPTIRGAITVLAATPTASAAQPAGAQERNLLSNEELERIWSAKYTDLRDQEYRRVFEQAVYANELASRIAAPQPLLMEELPTVDPDVAEKTEKNIWDNVQDFIKVLQAMREGKWWWFNNSRCKYVELRVDMRDGGCILKDRHGTRISPETLAYQYPGSHDRNKERLE